MKYKTWKYYSECLIVSKRLSGFYIAKGYTDVSRYRFVKLLLAQSLAPPTSLRLQFYFFVCFSLSLAPTLEHHVPVQYTFWTKGSTSDKQPHNTITKNLISYLKMRTVHIGLSLQRCYAWAGQLSYWSASPHSPAQAFTRVWYALVNPLVKTSPLREMGEISKK